jgi:hypothetical protein
MDKYLYLWVEATTLLVCIIFYRKFNLTRYKLFLPYLLIIVAYEWGAHNKLFSIHHSNHWIVNIELALEFAFYSFFILSAFRNKKERKIFTAIALSILAFTVIDILFIQGIYKLCSFAIVLQYGLLIVMVCRFFYNKLQDFEIDSSLLNQPDFWVNTGLLFFFLAEFLFFAAFDLAYIRPLSFSALFRIISGVANIILYSCIIISFICFRPTKTVSSSS